MATGKRSIIPKMGEGGWEVTLYLFKRKYGERNSFCNSEKLDILKQVPSTIKWEYRVTCQQNPHAEK